MLDSLPLWTVLEGSSETRVSAGMTRFVQSQEPLPHQVVSARGFLYVERSENRSVFQHGAERKSHRRSP